MAYASGVETIKATAFRKDFYRELKHVDETGKPVEIRLLGKPVAVLFPVGKAAGETGDRKPVIDLGSISEFCQRHRVQRFYLFGSVLRSDFGAESDVDVMIDVEGRALSFGETCGMLDELEVLFGRKVDMLTKHQVQSAATNPRRQASILESAALIYTSEEGAAV